MPAGDHADSPARNVYVERVARIKTAEHVVDGFIPTWTANPLHAPIDVRVVRNVAIYLVNHRIKPRRRGRFGERRVTVPLRLIDSPFKPM